MEFFCVLGIMASLAVFVGSFIGIIWLIVTVVESHEQIIDFGKRVKTLENKDG